MMSHRFVNINIYYNFLLVHSLIFKNKAPFRRLKLRYISPERDGFKQPFGY